MPNIILETLTQFRSYINLKTVYLQIGLEEIPPSDYIVVGGPRIEED